MEPRIRREVALFLKKYKLPILTLAQLAGIPQPTLSRLLSGARSDITSRNADALRDAMRHYEAYRREGGED